MKTTKANLQADGYDVAVISAELLDENGNRITDADEKIKFELKGAGENIGVDNGWEMSVENHKTNSITTYQGRAIVHVQSTKEAGEIKVAATVGNIKSNEVIVVTK